MITCTRDHSSTNSPSAISCSGIPTARSYGRRRSSRSKRFASRQAIERPRVTPASTVVDVAGRAGHSPETCLRYYAHLFAEFDAGVRASAEELIREARVDAGGRSRR